MSLSGIETAKNIFKIVVEDCPISDISTLEKAIDTGLNGVVLQNHATEMEITEVNLTNHKSLDAVGVIRAKLTKVLLPSSVTTLILSMNQMVDISCLSNLINLSTLLLNCNQI